MIRAFGLSALTLLLSFSAHAQTTKVYDSHRDPAKDLADAKVEAAAEHKNILLDVGGNWCSWCIILDGQLHEEPNRELLAKEFVLVHVNHDLIFHTNNKFLKQWPTVKSYPHLFVVSPDGKLLNDEDASSLAPDQKKVTAYDPAKIQAFLLRWSPSGSTTP